MRGCSVLYDLCRLYVCICDCMRERRRHRYETREPILPYAFLECIPWVEQELCALRRVSFHGT